MCKILIIPSIKESKRKETNDFIFEMAMRMSKANNHGLGYAAVNSSGDLFAEHWFYNYKFLDRPEKGAIPTKQDLLKKADDTLGAFGKALKQHTFKQSNLDDPISSATYNRMGNGVIEKDATAITLHTRMATCEKSLANVHPFVDQDTSIIHNGVIHNDDEFDLKLSTCDSESILISYIKSKVGNNPESVTKMAESLWGYYAVGAFARDGNGNRILDVFKANNFNLSIAYVFDLETYVISTSDSDIVDACSALGFKHGGTKDIVDDMLTRINPFTGEVISQVEFKSNANSNRPKQTDNVVRRNFVPTHQTRTPDVINYSVLYKLPSSIRKLNEREVEEFELEMVGG